MDFGWNPIFSMVMEIKEKYLRLFGNTKAEDTSYENCLIKWAEAIDDKKYTDFVSNIVVNQRENLILLKCITEKVANDLWNNENSIYRECRSIIIDIERDMLVLSPFAKIFNLNETPCTYEETVRREIESAELFEVTDKLDGSLQSARYYCGEIVMCDSFYFHPSELLRLADGYSGLVDNYKSLICENDEYTFSFEYLSLSNQQIVDYSSSIEGLYLIGMRDIRNGRQLPYKEIQAFATQYDVPMPTIENKTLDDILEDEKTLRAVEKEGWVINISLDGFSSRLIKIKVDDYLNIPTDPEEISSIDTIIRHIDKFDDFICKVPITIREECLLKYYKLIEIKFNLLEQINEYYEKAPKESTGAFMDWIGKNVPPNMIDFLVAKHGGEGIDIFSNNAIPLCLEWT